MLPPCPRLGPLPPPSLVSAPPLSPPRAPGPPSLAPAPPLPLPASGAAAPVTAAPPPPRGAPLPAQRPPKLRRFHWVPIPAARVQGRRSVWTGSSRLDGVPLDVQRLERLFREPPGWGPRGQPLLRRPQGQVSLLDSKKILNLEIFLKQFKRPVQQIVADLRDGAGALYGAEKLLELSKMLPDAEEVRKLKSFQGPWSRLSDAEIFTLLLLGVPSYTRRLELLVLKEEFFPQLNSLKSSIQILTEAAVELLECEELHVILRLVLQAGNYMNSGGYAGCAAGFRLASLLRLADTKANQPGMDLLHFVAMEAERKDMNLLDFPSKLPHVGPASRIQEQEVALELQRLAEHLAGAQSSLPELGAGQLEPFLQLAQAALGAGQRALERLGQVTASLCDFYCEDEARFCLQEVCAVLHAFGGRFRMAVQENGAREQAARRQQRLQGEQKKRRSIATCCACEVELQDVELDFLVTCTPWAGRRSRTQRGPCATLDSGARRCPVRAATPEPPARGEDAGWGSNGQRLLSRRHTLAVLPAATEPQDSVSPAPAAPSPTSPLGPTAPPVGRKVGLVSCLSSPGASPQASGCSPDISAPRRFPSLFRKKGPPKGAEGQDGPVSPRASPKGVSTLVGFFRHLSLGEKPRRPSEC